MIPNTLLAFEVLMQETPYSHFDSGGKVEKSGGRPCCCLPEPWHKLASLLAKVPAPARNAIKYSSEHSKKQPVRSNGLCRLLCGLHLQIAVNCDKMSL